MYYSFKKWIYIFIENPIKTMNKLKGVFKPLKCYFKFKISIFAPYPVLWVSKPSFIHIIFQDVMWKDKYDTPRYELPPYIWIHIWKMNFIWYWDLPNTLEYNKEDLTEEYWEQALWYLYYTNTISQGLIDKPDIKKARESWPWQDENYVSSWNDKFLTKNGCNR